MATLGERIRNRMKPRLIERHRGYGIILYGVEEPPPADPITLPRPLWFYAVVQFNDGFREGRVNDWTVVADRMVNKAAAATWIRLHLQGSQQRR